MPTKALKAKASKKTESRTGGVSRKNAADNRDGLGSADVEQAPLLGAAGSDLPESRAPSKQAKTAKTKGRTANGKSSAGASKPDNKEQQAKVQPSKRRNGSVAIASKSAEAHVGEGAAAAAKGASKDAKALESAAALQTEPEEAAGQVSAPELAVEGLHVVAGEEDDADEAPEEVCRNSTH